MEQDGYLFREYPAIFFLFFSVYVCAVSRGLGLGSLHKPGAGFMPFWSGALVGALALVLLIQDFRAAVAKPVEQGKETVNRKTIALTLVYFLAYIASLEYVGFIIGTVLFVGMILKTIEKKGWLLTVSASVAMAAASYYVFKVWLQAELPKGLLGF
jgi:putative tricarboxylic transport membrane protein